MRKLNNEQKQFVLSILKFKDEINEKELLREKLRGTKWMIGEDHPRYGELVSILSNQNVKDKQL